MVKPDTCLDGCIDPIIILSALNSVVQTFKVKITGNGGFEYTTEEITIKKICLVTPTSYTLIHNFNAVASSDTKSFIELPFLNIGDEDGCGIK